MKNPETNLMQIVWDELPAYPLRAATSWFTHAMGRGALRHEALPYSRKTITETLRRLVAAGLVEQTHPGIWRRCKNARRPVDMRGQHGNAGRPTKAKRVTL